MGITIETTCPICKTEIKIELDWERHYCPECAACYFVLSEYDGVE